MSPPDYDAMTFEELLGALEEITRRMAGGDIGIEEAAALYEEAGRLHALARERLDRVRERIERLDAGQS
ncbi:MAG: exodeoxyribonuclease VII small subunit [Acidimicrobiia bacterium]